jgi:hypothetical protein
MNTFWYVYNPNEEKPQYRHSSYQSALEEAGRLASTTYGGSFIVLEAKAIVSPPKRYEVTELSPRPLVNEDDQVPF